MQTISELIIMDFENLITLKMNIMKRLNLLLILVVLLFLQNETKSQFPAFTRIDTSIICTIGGSSNSGHWGDFNNDGFIDIFLVNNGQACRFYRNDFGLIFVDVAPTFGVNNTGNGRGNAIGDYNNDGLTDIVIGNFSQSGILFRNDSTTFTNVMLKNEDYVEKEMGLI